MDIIQSKDWGLGHFNGNGLLIAGPCSAESREQVLESCRGAAAQGAHILRAGIWKPRTRPGSFQGVGRVGLPWIVEAGKTYNRPVCVEVANGKHVEEALESGVDVLWVGARSTANPFTVQDIADALKGTDIPLLIKNPVNPDLELWLGAIERFYQAGIRKMALIFRGFSVYNPGIYRNRPMWQIPIELRRRYPQFEIICDPSHIAGKRELLHLVAQKAIDLDFDGFMIETHINPDAALSDARQQLTPQGLQELLNSLVRRKPATDDPDFLANLEALRYDIDRLDHEVIELLAKRMEVAQEIGKYKKTTNVTIFQLDRWSDLFNERIKAALEAGLSLDFAQEFIQDIHNESIRQQMIVMGDEEEVNDQG
jgi:chorismate mutase